MVGRLNRGPDQNFRIKAAQERLLSLKQVMETAGLHTSKESSVKTGQKMKGFTLKVLTEEQPSTVYCSRKINLKKQRKTRQHINKNDMDRPRQLIIYRISIQCQIVTTSTQSPTLEVIQTVH